MQSTNYQLYQTNSVYYTIFDSHLSHGNLIWGQNINTNGCPTIPQKKALRLTNVKAKQYRIFSLFLSQRILNHPKKSSSKIVY